MRTAAFLMLAALSTAAARSVLAQTAQRSAIVGRVLDGTGAPLRDATVTLDGTSVLGGARVLTTGPDGRYRFASLLPGTYVVTAEAPGFAQRRGNDIDLPVETTYTVDLTLSLSPLSQHVEVTSEMPIIDVTTAASPAVFQASFLQSLPTGRTLESVLNLAPGVTAHVAFGGTAGSNGLAIDRVPLVEPSLGRSWIPVSYNWLGSVQVVAIGASAEYGQTTGAIANGVIRSGSSTFSGLAEYMAAVPSWTANNVRSLGPQFQKAFTPRQLLAAWDANIQLGGPLRPDRAWFFVGADAAQERFRPFGYTGSEKSQRTEPRVIAKLDVLVARQLQVQGLYHRDVSNLIGDELGPSMPTLVTAGDRRRRNHLWNSQLSWTPGRNTQLAVVTSGFTGRLTLDPHPPATLEGPPPQNDWISGLVSGNILTYQRDNRSTIATAVRVAHARRLFGQSHEVTVGVESELARARSFYRPPSGRVDTLFDGVLQWTTFTTGSLTRTTNHRTTVYVQDRWRVGDRLTLEPGVRIDRHTGAVPGRGLVFRTLPVGLRAGAAWDISRNHRTVVRAHYGRYYDSVFSYIYSFQDTAAISTRIDMIEVSPGTFEEVSRSADGAPAFAIAPRLRQSHVDQWTVGAEHQLAPNLAAETRFVHRHFGNFIGYVDRRLDEWVPFRATDPGPDGRLGTGDDGGQLTGYVPYWWPDNTQWDLTIANPEGAFRRYDAVQFIARKRYAQNWEAQASYTWSRSVGTVSGRSGNNAALTDLSPYGFGGAPGGTTSFRDQGITRSLFDYTELKLLASYRLRRAGGVGAGAVYRWHTGSRWHRTAVIPAPFSGYMDFAVAETPFSRQTPAIAQLDLRLEKTFSLPSSSRVGAYIDALNATNTGRALKYVARSGARFAEPAAWTDPRTLRVGIRYEF